MNGELYQISAIVTAAKRALQSGNPIQYDQVPYENSVQFELLPQKWIFGTRKITCPDVSAWYNELKKIGLQDIKMLAPTSVKDRNFLGFINTSQGFMACFYESGKVTYFRPKWEFDSAKQKWDVLYTEHEWENHPEGRPRFEDNTNAFRKALTDIQRFATEIECDNFAEIFGKALRVLDEGVEVLGDKSTLPLLPLPDSVQNIFEAASNADVFGAMGSWNDSPAAAAHSKGLGEAYDRLSDELLKNVRLGILYAVNEW